MMAHTVQKLYIKYQGYPEVGHPLAYRLYLFNRETQIESKYAILQRECGATFSYLLLCFVPQYCAATGIITIESVIFPKRFWVGPIYNKFIVSSSDKIFYIQMHCFTHKSMLNQTLYYTICQFAVVYYLSNTYSRFC